MIKIKEENYRQVGHMFDYLLENGALLHESEWNGEVYITKDEHGRTEEVYRPVYDENENENGGYDIIGFEID